VKPSNDKKKNSFGTTLDGRFLKNHGCRAIILTANWATRAHPTLLAQN
jgi:hypothetical protein